MDLKRQKLINAVIYFCTNTKMCGKTKLVKLLYYLDFMHFRQTAKSVTDLQYYAWQFGPYPVSFGNEIDHPPTDLTKALLICKEPEKKSVTIKCRVKFDKDVFSRRELKLLEQIAFIFKEARAEDIVEASHLPNHPWDKTLKLKGEKAEIDYMLALDSQTGSISLEEAKERIHDRKVLRELAATTQR
jgi:uncharacterized phage-associated protein